MFDSLGLSCQSRGPSEVSSKPTCGGELLHCDAALEQELESLMARCSYTLDENSVEFFFEQGCAAGLTLGRSDAEHVGVDAQRCVLDGLGHMRASCAQALCIRFEHSTLASP